MEESEVRLRKFKDLATFWHIADWISSIFAIFPEFITFFFSKSEVKPKRLRGSFVHFILGGAVRLG